MYISKSGCVGDFVYACMCACVFMHVLMHVHNLCVCMHVCMVVCRCDVLFFIVATIEEIICTTFDVLYNQCTNFMLLYHLTSKMTVKV